MWLAHNPETSHWYSKRILQLCYCKSAVCITCKRASREKLWEEDYWCTPFNTVSKLQRPAAQSQSRCRCSKTLGCVWTARPNRNIRSCQVASWNLIGQVTAFHLTNQCERLGCQDWFFTRGIRLFYWVLRLLSDGESLEERWTDFTLSVYLDMPMRKIQASRRNIYIVKRKNK